MSSKNKPSLFDACGMAIGGMVGGGIFAVLGEAVMTAGNAAFISMGIGGLLALITGVVYAKLTIAFDETGGSFIFMEHIAGAQFAGTISWFLILGYTLTISLYAYVFGAYAGRLLGFGSEPNFWLGSGVIVFIALLNFTRFIKGIPDHILFYFKMILLLSLIGLGFTTVHPNKIVPIINRGIGNTFEAGALVFVAYEGFQLLTYDYVPIVNRKTNLLKAIVISISSVLAVYMLITFVLTGSLGAAVIAEHKETVVAMLAEPVLGQSGIIVVLIAAVISTASAIHATMFSVCRLGNRIASDDQLPHQLTDYQREDIPIYFILLITTLSIALQLLGNLEQLTTFASMVFLFVFSIVNYMGYKHNIFIDWKRFLPIAGLFGCVSGMGVLIYKTYYSNLTNLCIIIGISIALLLCREAYMWFHSGYKGA